VREFVAGHTQSLKVRWVVVFVVLVFVMNVKFAVPFLADFAVILRHPLRVALGHLLSPFLGFESFQCSPPE
jgi:hypothetical protein